MFDISLEEKTSSYKLLDAITSNVGGIKTYTEVHMPPHILSEDEVRVNLQRSKRVRYFIQVCLRIEGCESSDVDVL